MTMFRALTLASLVVYASAQSLSAQCTQALTGIAANPEANACLSPGALVPIIAGGATSSVVAPINNWLTSLCGAPACSNATISAVVQNVTQGCSTELGAFGLSSGAGASITPLIQQYYPTVRQVICLKDGNTNCVTQTLTNIENAVGSLTLSNIVQVVLNPPSTIPKNVTCTDCVKAAYNILAKDIPSIVSDAAPALQSQCDAAFVDGTTPVGITQSASTASGASSPSTSNNAAVGGVSALSQGGIVGLAVSGLVVISTLFTFLA